jgi:hypothetical protein
MPNHVSFDFSKNIWIKLGVKVRGKGRFKYIFKAWWDMEGGRELRTVKAGTKVDNYSPFSSKRGYPFFHPGRNKMLTFWG